MAAKPGFGLDRPSDFAQASLVRALELGDQFKGGTEGELRAWLSRVIISIFLNQLKRSSHWRLLRPVAEVAEAQAGSESSVRHSQAREAVAKAATKLTDEQQFVLALSMEGWTLEGIGAVLDKTADATRMIKTRAVTELGRWLAFPLVAE